MTLLEFAETVSQLSISLLKMSNTFHSQLRICMLHKLARSCDLSHAYDFSGRCFLIVSLLVYPIKMGLHYQLHENLE